MILKHFNPQLKRSVSVALLAAALAALGGCSTGWYRESADREVYGILDQRKKVVLDYRPDTKVVTPSEDPQTPPRAYARIPTTPIPPRSDAPIELSNDQAIPVSRMGPPKVSANLPPLQESTDLSQLGAYNPDWTNPLVAGPPAPRGNVYRFGLFDALRYATDHSRDYQSQVEDLYFRALDVTLERHLLSPRPFATSELALAGGQKSTDYNTALTATNSVGVRQKLPYGGEIVASALVRFVNALSDNAGEGESAALVINGSIPLLRGAGLVNLEGLISSERGLVYTIRDFENFRRSFTVRVASQYFSLLSQQQSVKNQRQNLNDLRSLLERTRALFGAGRLTFLEVQRSEQAVLFAENALLNAVENYQNATDDFKIQLGMAVVDDLDVVPVELNVNIPDFQRPDVLETAYEYRLDLRTAQDRIDDARRQVEIAKNGLLPDLNLTAQTGGGNNAGGASTDLDSRTLTYSAGITLDLPIDRLAERNVYRRSLIGFQQAGRAYDLLKDQIAADVRSATRAIRSAQATLEIQRRNIELAERRVELAYELLKTDKADARDIVEATNDLLGAQDSFETARAQLQIQVLQFLQNTGTLRVDPAAGEIGRALDRRTGGDIHALSPTR